MTKANDTAEYSATKAPDTRREAEERESTRDMRLIPGGERGTPTPQGMAGLETEDRRDKSRHKPAQPREDRS
jgi:hypothetical protein